LIDMSETPLKIVPAPEAKTAPATEAPAAKKSGRLTRLPRKRLRMILLVAIPAAAALIGLGLYLSGGRYISTDNAYVGAQKVLITPDVSDKIIHVAVVEGQHVKPGDELFTLDPVPFRLALEQAKAKLDTARSDYDKLKTNLASLTTLVELANKNVELKRRDVDRKSKLVSTQAGSQADLDTAGAALVTAQLQAQFATQQRDTTLNQLLGNPELPLAQFPEYAQAKAALDSAQRDFDHTVVRAPISGTATQVDNIQVGRFVAAGTPILSVIDDQAPWVDANPKETDITYLRVGQKATLEVDSFPDHTFTGHVIAVSPGTGAQFSILPPQNATGNWVKVVQRVPVRIAFDKDEDTHLLRSGMSVNVAVDTGHSRLPFLSANAKEAEK
jgi:membrane fusion protein (multidrug efflux system)